MAQAIIDCDVHHGWASEAALIEYLSPEWREFVALPDGQAFPLLPPMQTFPLMNGTNKRLDSFPPDGSAPGSHYPTMAEQLLDPFHVEAAILGFDVGLNVNLPNVYLATDVVRAANDWSRDNWLDGRDDRLYGAVLAPAHLPTEAAAEIRRVGQHDRIVEVRLAANALGKPFGHPLYHPIYEAAAEMNLPIAIHNGGDTVLGTGQTAAGGLPNSRLEWHTLMTHSVAHHLTSFVVHGVFEKYPSTRLLLLEVGVSWLPWLLWGLDSRYDVLRRESPWVKKWPSEYFRDHVLVGTQPLEETDGRHDLVELLASFGGLEENLVFASDYPHWDTDDPTHFARRFPREWVPKLFRENAQRAYRWPSDVKTRALDPAST